MDAFDSTQEEFDEDFGAPAPSDAELLELLGLARSSANVPLRRLVYCYRTLRRVGADVVTDVVEEYGRDAVDRSAPLQLLEFFTRATRA